MIPVRLETRDGVFVHEAEIPPFKLLPEVLFWGFRTFVLGVPPAPGEPVVYREAFAYSLTSV